VLSRAISRAIGDWEAFGHLDESPQRISFRRRFWKRFNIHFKIAIRRQVYRFLGNQYLAVKMGFQDCQTPEKMADKARKCEVQILSKKTLARLSGFATFCAPSRSGKGTADSRADNRSPPGTGLMVRRSKSC
jgi:hypothetical protein